MQLTVQSHAHFAERLVARTCDAVVRHRLAIFATLLLLLALTALTVKAGTTGAEYKAAYEYFVGLITGYPGKIAAIMIGLGGVLMSWSKGSPLWFAGAILIGIVIWNLPTIIDGIFTATI
ncbi:hypothetical protein [Cupriavidus sp. YAF13]|uniref:hypothetical protein n=1 Tax=Cupriavidus sp. YAF13 TaxID=3233075 RepID=UPI003F93292E